MQRQSLQGYLAEGMAELVLLEEDDLNGFLKLQRRHLQNSPNDM